MARKNHQVAEMTKKLKRIKIVKNRSKLKEWPKSLETTPFKSKKRCR